MNVDILPRFDRMTRISKGMAGDEKYRVEKGGASYLLRIADGTQYPTEKREYDFLKHLNQASLPVPSCIAFGTYDSGTKVYTLLSWVDGEETEKVLPRVSGTEQYAYGVQAGQILRKIHESVPIKVSPKNWYDRYFEVIGSRLEAYRKDEIPFAGSDRILGFIKDNRPLLKARPLCHHHGDYHMGNLIVKAGKLWVIDWHTVDFHNIGDPWYEFNRIGVEYPMFARRQIDGYFEHRIPEEFWRLFALYFATSATTSIVWAKYRVPDQLDSITERNEKVVHMFDRMENPIPRWYRA